VALIDDKDVTLALVYRGPGLGCEARWVCERRGFRRAFPNTCSGREQATRELHEVFLATLRDGRYDLLREAVRELAWAIHHAHDASVASFLESADEDVLAVTLFEMRCRRLFDVRVYELAHRHRRLPQQLAIDLIRDQTG